jgi:hypothetical protein
VTIRVVTVFGGTGFLGRRIVQHGAFNAPMLWNGNFFITLESMKNLRQLAKSLMSELLMWSH